MRLIILAAAAFATAATAQTSPAPAAPAAAAPVAAAPARSPEAPARAPEAMQEARAKLVAADANKDGKWDKAEWLAAGRREMGFAFCDTGKDGFVDPAELKVCAEKARAMGMTAQ
jgi:hypothetical protein